MDFAQKISTVARVEACYVACSNHLFSHRKCFVLEEAAGTATPSLVPSGHSKHFDICFPLFYILFTFRMRDQSFCFPDVLSLGGQNSMP